MTSETAPEIRLTQFSHGAGCGCKLSPKVLDTILSRSTVRPDARLLVGNDSRDDAAVYDLGNGQALISTTDFFMPIVDDPTTFGRIAAANAVSDVYAMGGTPVLAIGILGWPVDKLPAEIAGDVVEGGRSICTEAGMSLAGGHSIDSPEPIFGLAVNGVVAIDNLKRNDTARAGDVLYLTKGLGVGLLTTAEKQGVLLPEDKGRAAEQMTRLNKIGQPLGTLSAVHAMTDVTGFGLLGHLGEMCAGSGLRAEIDFAGVPRIAPLEHYLKNKTIPGGTHRNWASYGDNVGEISDEQRAVLCDPQTSGGLLVAVHPERTGEVEAILTENALDEFAHPIGVLREPVDGTARITVN